MKNVRSTENRTCGDGATNTKGYRFVYLFQLQIAALVPFLLFAHHIYASLRSMPEDEADITVPVIVSGSSSVLKEPRMPMEWAGQGSRPAAVFSSEKGFNPIFASRRFWGVFEKFEMLSIKLY